MQQVEMQWQMHIMLQVLESTKDTTKDNEPMCFEIGAGEIVANPLFQVHESLQFSC